MSFSLSFCYLKSGGIVQQQTVTFLLTTLNWMGNSFFVGDSYLAPHSLVKCVSWFPTLGIGFFKFDSFYQLSIVTGQVKCLVINYDEVGKNLRRKKGLLGRSLFFLSSALAVKCVVFYVVFSCCLCSFLNGKLESTASCHTETGAYVVLRNPREEREARTAALPTAVGLKNDPLSTQACSKSPLAPLADKTETTDLYRNRSKIQYTKAF